MSFDLAAGSVTALIGENGAGKSTIVKILTGIYRPDEGEVRIGGEIARLTRRATPGTPGSRRSTRRP